MKNDVLIAGAGPVGMTMAIELARYGVAVRIVDKAPERTDKSKALVIWSRTLELLERSGCTAVLIDAGYKVTTVNLSAEKKPIAQFSLEGVETAYPYTLMIPQNETERVLDEFLTTLGVKVERGVELTQFAASATTIVSTLRHSDGTEESLETSWLIGCDGAHSFVRHKLGMEFSGETSPVHWLLADIHLEGVARSPAINIAWHSDGVLASFPIAENRYRIIADSGENPLGDAEKAPPSLEQIQSILDKRFPGSPRASDPIWLSSFTINERKVKDYRAGRVFLAGDAAHVHSPAGGQGMNTGMQDSCNLAWKLAMVIRGSAEDTLLESYSQERSPIAEEVLKVTGRMTKISTLSGQIAQSLRNDVASLVMGLSPVRKLAANVASEIAIRYAHSPLNGPNHHGEPAPGSRAPIREKEAPVGAGDSPRFVLFGEADGIPPDLLTRHAKLVEANLRAPYHPGGLWLVRPDGYVALAVKSGDWASVETYLSRLGN
ncbi:MAG: FAD-dependent monooxygenase [Acidobacteriaceae bacterium]